MGSYTREQVDAAIEATQKLVNKGTVFDVARRQVLGAVEGGATGSADELVQHVRRMAAESSGGQAVARMAKNYDVRPSHLGGAA